MQVVVIGAGMGGLSAAIHSRLQGHDTIVLERHETPGGKAAGIVQDGFHLDPGPSIIILTKLYEQVFKAAGRKMPDYLTFKRLDPFSRVYFEGEDVLDLPANREACLELLSQRFPEDAAAFKRLMAKLDKAAPHIEHSIFKKPYDKSWHLADPHLIAFALQFNVRQTYRELVDEAFKNPLLRAFFYGFPSYGGQSYHAKAPGAFLIPYLMLEEGVFYPEGGVAAIPKAFHRLAIELGVEFRFKSDVVEIEKAGKRITAVKTATERFPCEAVISNLDRSTTEAMLGRTHQEEPSFSYFTIHWGLNKMVEGLEHHTLFVPKNFEKGFKELYDHRKFPDPPIVYLNATHVTDDSVAPDGCSNLFAVVTAPAMHKHIDWKAETSRYREVVRSEMAKHGVEWQESDIVMERIQTPNYFQKAHGNYRGSLYGLNEKHRLFGMLPPRNQDEEFSNLLYCGGSVQPGAGLPMVTLSGKFASERLKKL